MASGVDGAGGVLGDGADHLELARDLVEETAADFDQVGADLTGQAEHGRVGGVGGRERGRGVEEPGTGDDEADPLTTGDAGIAIGHVGSCLLVAGVDDADRIALVVEGVEETVELDAGETEDGVDALALEGGDERLPAGHRSLLVCCCRVRLADRRHCLCDQSVSSPMSGDGSRARGDRPGINWPIVRQGFRPAVAILAC